LLFFARLIFSAIADPEGGLGTMAARSPAASGIAPLFLAKPGE